MCSLECGAFLSSPKKAIKASEAPPKAIASIYPEALQTRVKGRLKKPLGDVFGIKAFGVNLTELAPDSDSALFHEHTKQEEFIYILSGTPTLVIGGEEIQLSPGMCAGFVPGRGAHMLSNRSKDKVVYLEIGDRTPGDEASYPNDDLKASFENGAWKLTRKDGTPY